MSSSKEKKERKPFNPSPKQKASLLYGQRLRGLGNVGELIKHLKELGAWYLANTVHQAAQVLSIKARKEYEDERLRLDPEFETSAKRTARLLKEWADHDRISTR